MPLHTELPPRTDGHFGEHQFATQIVAFQDDHAHLWFGAKVPGVNDIDLLLYHENAGVFCIEVKAVGLASVEDFGQHRCHIRGRNPDDGPHNQANRGRDSLLDYLRSNHRFRDLGENLGFVKSTACWPRISRNQWNQKWNNPALNQLAEAMLFEDDIAGGRDVLIQRLDHIARHPPVGKGNMYPFSHKPARLSALIQAMDERGAKTAAPSDLAKLRIIEKEVTKQALSEAPVLSTSKCLYSGHPGTGKTFRLLQIGVHHALAGKRVLFACFNKTLAADIRRLLSYSDKLTAVGNIPDVYDVWRMIKY